MEPARNHVSWPAGDSADPSPETRSQAIYAAAEVTKVPILSLRPADSPRLNGEDKGHILRLAEMETSLPPILVDKSTMRVIDGMHRLMAASLQGRDEIDVIFFDGSEADTFLRAVQENVTHGLPLTQADRRAAAERIIASHPNMSDRAIGQVAGLAAKTVATIRKRSTDSAPQSNGRVGMDGKVRPLDWLEGRRRAAELLARQPDASLRDVARGAGISPATALDVRKRLERGDVAAPGKPKAPEGVVASGEGAKAVTPVPHSAARTSSASHRPTAIVEKLLRDPSLRGNERGKGVLRLLHINAVGSEQLPEVAAAVPPHCVTIIVQLARQYAEMWHDFAMELDGRARIIDPLLPVLATDWTAQSRASDRSRPPRHGGGGIPGGLGQGPAGPEVAGLGGWHGSRPGAVSGGRGSRIGRCPDDRRADGGERDSLGLLHDSLPHA